MMYSHFPLSFFSDFHDINNFLFFMRYKLSSIISFFMGKRRSNLEKKTTSQIFDSEEEKVDTQTPPEHPKGKGKKKIQKLVSHFVHNEEVRKGRPARVQVDDSYDPTLKIKNQILLYFYQIGLKHGLIFPDRCKIMFQDPSVYSDWSEWSQEEEQVKAKKSLQQYCEGADLHLTCDQLVFFMVKIGDILPRWSTMELYDLLAFTFASMKEPKGQKALENIFRGFQYFNKSTIIKPVDYYNETVGSDIILKCFKQFMEKIATLIEDTLRQVQKIHGFIDQVMQEEQQLKAMITLTL